MCILFHIKKVSSIQWNRGTEGKFSHYMEGKTHALDFTMKEETPIGAARGGVVVNEKDDLNEKSLEAIYNLYKSTSLVELLLLGFTIYQSLELHDFMLLTTEGIDLHKCTIYIPSGKHLKNSRTLSLKAKQILPIQNYLHQKSSSSDLLFLGDYSKNSIADRLTTIHKSLKILTKESDIKYQHLRQLRQSRMVQWIKQHGLREAQYLSGHKGISSIERYQKQDIEDLRKQIQKFHPLG